MKMKKSISGCLALLLILTPLGGCGSSAEDQNSNNGQPVKKEETGVGRQDTPETSSGSKEVTVYAAFPDYELPTYFNAFEKDTGIKVNYVRLSAGEMLSRVEAEKDNPNASVMYGGGTDAYIAATEQGLLEQYQSSELENVNDQYKDPEGYYNPISYGVITFACNKEWFEENNMEYPTSWQDLLKPEFKDQISVSHPATAGTGYAFLATVIMLMGEEEGWDYLQKLNENVRQYTRAGTAPCSEVGLGEAAIGITYAQGALSTASEGYPIELSYPKEGTQCEITGVALIKNGKEEEQENARLLIDWLISKRGQELYIDSNSFRSPVNITANATEGLPKIEEITLVDYDVKWAADNRESLNTKFTELINNAEDLIE